MSEDPPPRCLAERAIRAGRWRRRRCTTLCRMSTERAHAQPSSGAAGTADIGVTGLAVMGSNIARNFARRGYTVAVHNRSAGKTDALLAEHGGDGEFVRTET